MIRGRTLEAEMEITRRDALTSAGLTAMAAGLSGPTEAQMAQPTPGKPTNLRLRQSVCRWCYAKIPLDEFYKGVVDSGLTAVDLLNEEEWTRAKDFGLSCSMGYAGAGGIPNGLNDPSNHELIVTNMTKTLPIAKAAGIPNLIVFFGNRNGMSDADGIKNSIECLNRIKGPAEDNGVTVCVELLNSKVNHKDYIGDRTPYGAEIIRAVNSPRVKLLYDIYHMQIMEGDVIRTIQTYQDTIAHYHTGGVPGRNELDATQELNWPAICRAIVDLGYKGFMAHEFIPKREPMTSLREAIALCDV
jgi:hydroxypyruvate isomerase